MVDFTKPANLLKQELKKMQPYDLALLYPQLTDEEKTCLRQLLDYKRVIKLFEELPDEEKLLLFNELPTVERKKKLLDSLSIDELRDFILLFNERDIIIDLLKKPKQYTIRKILLYNDNLAASIMNPEVIRIKANLTVKEATAYVIQNAQDNHFIDDIFIVNDNSQLIGVISLKDLIIARKDDLLTTIIDDDPHFIYNDNAIFEAIDIVKNYDLKSLPVVDGQKHILGVITADDILDEIYDDKVEDYQKLAALSDYTVTSSGFSRSLKRLPWLILGIVVSLFIANFVLIFEKVIATVAALLIFQSLVLDTCGNIGTQSLAVTILKLNTNELNTRGAINEHLRKEVGVALINAIIIGIYGFVIAFGFLNIPWILNKNMELLVGTKLASPLLFTLGLALVVLISLTLSMFISAILGVIIPLIAHRNKFDPANVSGPVLTTINDIIALITYFATAALFLSIVA